MDDIFKLDWDWSRPVLFNEGDEEAEVLESDKLDRVKYAEYLYHHLIEMGNKNNTVINLNAEWGAGKTFFIKRMFSSIKKEHPCIYIDAWKQDFSDDAFLTIFSSLISQLEKYAGNIDSSLINVGSAIGRFTKGLIPEILSGLAKQYVGIESMGDISKTAADLMLSEHKEKMNAVISLRKELKFWGDLCFEREYSAPIFIFIDELDRCRPNYAVSLLEVVKHIFSVEKFVFVISTDTNQLQHSIKNLYGNDFGASDYLNRFFHRRFTLKAPNMELLVREKIEALATTNWVQSTKNLMPPISELHALSFNISSIFHAFELDLRSALRNTDRLIDIIQGLKIKSKLDYIALMCLMIIYDKDRDIIDKLSGKLNNTEKIEDLLISSSKLKGFGLNYFNLIIDNSSNNIQISYVYKASSNSGRYTISLGREEIKISTKIYLMDFNYFIHHITQVRQSKERDGSNNLLTVSSEISDREKIKLHRGAIFEIDHRQKIYNIDDYINFIELATSFD